jgi:hypothetical protein
VKQKPNTKAEERAIIEQRFAKRILAEHAQAWSLWHDRSLQLQNDPVRIRAWVEAHGKPVTHVLAAAGLGYTGTNAVGDVLLLTWEQARELAYKEAGPEPQVIDLLKAVAGSAKAR